MGERDSSTRNFHTVAKNNKVEREKQRKQQQKHQAMILILTCIILILSLFAIVIFRQVFAGLPSRPDDTTSPEDTTPPPEGIVYVKRLYATSDINRGPLILINDSFPYVFPSSAPTTISLYNQREKAFIGMSPTTGNKLYSYYTQTSNSATLSQEAFDALCEMTNAFYEATGNIDLFVYDADGYRSEADQKKLYDKAVLKYGDAADSYEAKPGITEHHTGLAIDLYVYTADGKMYNLDSPATDGVFNWIYENSYRYGFIERYAKDKVTATGISYEPYHFRYVGYEHAYYMHQNNLCLEEYLELIRSHSYNGEHFTFTADNGSTYEIYYVMKTGDITEVPVPKNHPYTISGDNSDGFIVTFVNNG